MDFSGYSQEIQALHAEYDMRVGRSDVSAIRVLGKLRKLAEAQSDDLLLGYVYHSYAFVEYFIRGRYNAFLKYLRLSARCLQRCGDQTEFAHVYYLIALDAMNKGMYDLACSNFLQARDRFIVAGNETSAAIMDLSIGHVLQMIYSYRDSLSYVRRARKVVRRNPQHPHFISNLASLYMNEGICELGLGHLPQAEKACAHAQHLLEQHEGQYHKGTSYDYCLLRTNLLLAQGKTREMRESFSQLLAMTPSVAQVANYIEEIRKLTDRMIACGEHALVEELLRILSEDLIPEKATNAHRILVDIQINYLMAIGDRDRLAKYYERQRAIHRQLVEDQKTSYRLIRDLIHLVGDLREEMELAQEEHDSLLYLAQTDVLTGIPNRMAMTEHLNRVFEDAYHAQRHLGVCMVDVDGLKEYNDRYGHTEGDRCLTELGALLRDLATDPHIFAARYGGDEFVLVYEGMTNDEIRAHANALAKKSPLHISQGICNLVPHEAIRIWDYMRRADAAMYEAKKSTHAGKRVGDICFSS